MLRRYFFLFLAGAIFTTVYNIAYIIPPSQRSVTPWNNNFTPPEFAPPPRVNMSEWLFNFSHEDYIHGLVFFDYIIN